MTPQEKVKKIIESNPEFANVDYETALANYLDSEAERNTKELPEIEVKAKPISRKIETLPNEEEARNILAVLKEEERNEKLSNVSPQTLIYRINVRNNDLKTNSTSPSGENIMQHVVQPIMNLYLPDLWVGAAFDVAQNKRGFWESLGNGNSGFVSDNFAENNPIITSVVNALGSGVSYVAPYKFYKWGNTYKLKGSGAEFDVYSKPFERNVVKFGSTPPEEIALKETVPGTVPMKYIGQTDDGLYGYTLKKVFVPKKLPNKDTMSKLYQHMVDKGWFPFLDLGMLDFVKLKETKGKITPTYVTDLGEGNIGFNNMFDWVLGRRPVIIDNSVLNQHEYSLLNFKKGGKL